MNSGIGGWNRRQFVGAGLAGMAHLPLSAQEVAMGARKAGAKRLEAPYTLEVETPHVKWASPLPGGPIRLLAVPTVSEGRTLVELAQRLQFDLTTVTIDPAWDLNKWTMCFGSDYGARAERGDLNLIYSYLEEELVSSRHFDAVLISLSHGWKRLTAKSREALVRRVAEGCGLVLIRPFASELAPLEPDVPPPSEEDELEEPAQPGPVAQSPWKRTRDHYITRAIPIESFPFQYLSHYVCRPALGAEVLVSTESGHPIAGLKTHGKGRVVAFAWRNAGLSWHMPMEARNSFTDVYWEYFYALMCRALIFAARREPAAGQDWSVPSIEWRVRDRFARIVRTGTGPEPAFDGLPPGRFFVESQSASDFVIRVIDVPQPDSIENLRVSRPLISEGDLVEVTWKSTRPARIELVDALGRVIAAAEGEGRVELRAGRPLVHSGWVRATAGAALEQTPVRFAASSREWTGYEILLPWYGPRTYQPWIPAVDRQFRRIGITTLASPDRNFRLMVSAHLAAFGIYWYRRENYLKRKRAYAETGDKKFLTRDITLQSADFEAGVRKELDARVRPVAALKPFAYYLADESSLTCYTDPFDVDWAPDALRGFRQWLQREHGSLEILNRNWGTSFASWDDVVPMTTAEARRHGNFAPWSDHRVYMDREFAKAFERALQWLREIDPEARGSISGTQVPTAHNGCDWYEIDQRLDYIQPYSGGNQDAMHYLFKPGLLITGFTGYGLVGEQAQAEQWRRLFYGHTGASIFWQYTLMNPDLTLSEQGKALAETFVRLQAGIGKMFQHSRVREDGVAIHFSMASIRGAWISDGTIGPDMQRPERASPAFAELMRRHDTWVKELERRGVQFRFLATPQIEAGELRNYKVLILPYSIALSDREAAEIEAFAARGGTVYTDEHAGHMDERCRWRKEPPWTASRPDILRRGPGDVGIPRVIEVEGDSLTTVREFGQARILGVQPAKPSRIALPESKGVFYDLVRGGLAPSHIEASPGLPLLVLERSSRIADLRLDDSLLLTLTDETGAPIDRSVIHVEVFYPEGERADHYCTNVLLSDGRAQVRIPFALSDARPGWRIEARDIISGLTASRRFHPQPTGAVPA